MNNIEVTKSAWSQVNEPSKATILKVKVMEKEVTIPQRYLALLAAILTMLIVAFVPMAQAGGDWSMGSPDGSWSMGAPNGSYPMDGKNTLIANHKIAIGFTMDEVLQAWGQPDDMDRMVSDNGMRVSWTYHDPYASVSFHNGIVDNIYQQ
jgi:hypothetical protein